MSLPFLRVGSTGGRLGAFWILLARFVPHLFAVVDLCGCFCDLPTPVFFQRFHPLLNPGSGMKWAWWAISRDFRTGIAF